MARLPDPDPVKLFIAVLFRDEEALRVALSSAEEAWGPLDYTGAAHPFDVTDYYVEEMGRELTRRLVGFRRLVSPDLLPDAKLGAIEIEDRSREDGARTVNLDVGYLDHSKYVLASTKPAGQKIWLRDGIWADIQGRYARGAYRPFEWTFPDLADGRYDDELVEMRRLYLALARDDPGEP